MCGGLFKTPKPPAAVAPPVPDPAPVITPSEVSPQTESDRRARISKQRMGLASTIKTPRVAANLNPMVTGKTTLG